MAIPKFEDFLYPFMSHLMTKDSNKSDMIDVLSKHFNLSDEDCLLKTRGGSTYQVSDRVGWSLQWLRRALFVDIPEKGVWRITQRGRTYMESHNDLRECDLLQYPEFAEYSGTKPNMAPLTRKSSPLNEKKTLYMKHNENWLEIIETIKPVIASKSSYLLYCNAVVTIFRILGWKKATGTLVTFSSSDPNTNESLIFLNIERDNLHIPIVPLDLNRVYSEDTRVSTLFKAMKEMNCAIGLLFSDTIQIYFHNISGETKPVCILNIPFDDQVECGHLLCNLLSFNVFSFKILENFCVNEYEKLPTKSNLPKRLLAFSQDSQLIASFLKDYLISEGFGEEQIDEELNKYTYKLRIKGLTQNEEIESIEKRGGSNDTTKFSLDGGKTFLRKRFFVLEVIRQYIKDNPFVTIDDLEKTFPSEIISKKRGVVRPLSVVQEWVSERPDIAVRFFMDPDEIITLHDGMQIVVHNQWGSHFPKFLEIAKRFYHVTSNQPYLGIEKTEQIEMVDDTSESEEKIGIKISADSFSKFRNKK